MSTHLLIGNENIRPAIEARLLQRYNALHALMSATVDARGDGWRLSDLSKAAGTLAAALADGLASQPPIGEGMAVRAAHHVLDALVDVRERRDPAFWSTPLGRAVAYWTGGEEAAERPGALGGVAVVGVHRAEAAAVLGISRQALHELMAKNPKRFDPRETSPTGVSSEGLKRELRERYPLEAS